MKANQGNIACATSHEEVDWHAIKWQEVNQNVRRLQARIVKATQEGRWGKVKALQHLLTHSFRQSPGRSTGDRKSRQEHTRNRWRNLEHTHQEGKGGTFTTPAGLSAVATQTNIHP